MDAPCPAGSASSTSRALITGGSGYVGFRLATALSKQGIQVVLLDIAPPSHPLPPGVVFCAGNVADAAAVEAAFTVAAVGDAISPASPIGAVFHVASYGMSGRELRDRAKIQAVNVDGTRNIISACLRHGVPRLVYVSTCNVIFVGRPISGGDEAAPYPPPSAYKDAYSATKAQAERLILEADGRPLLRAAAEAAQSRFTPKDQPLPDQRKREGQGNHHHEQQQQMKEGEEQQDEGGADGAERGSAGPSGSRPERGSGSSGSGRLHACCIRSTGIWGPGETRHQARVIRTVRAGMFLATFGELTTLTDWIHVDNLVQILILAERKLRLPEEAGIGHHHEEQPSSSSCEAGRGCSGMNVIVDGGGSTRRQVPIAAGQVFYASDGEPINNFDHFKPLIMGLGYRFPALNLPSALVYAIAAVIEYAWPLLSRLVRDPPLTRMEVDKCCVEHWFDIGKARRELGYEPVSYDRADVVRYMAAAGWAAGADVGGGTAAAVVVVLSAMAVAAVVFLLAAAYSTGGS